MIEDLSEDAALDEFEKKEMAEANKPPVAGVPPNIPGIFTDDDEFAGVDDYAEEYTDKDGNHIRKEVHSGNGWKSVEYSSTSTGGIGGAIGGSPFGGGDIMGDLIAQVMAQ